MSDVVIVAVVGGICGIITTFITGVPKIYEMWKVYKGDTVEARIEKAMQEAMKKCSSITNEKLDGIQRDVTRLRLMLLMYHEPDDVENILVIGKIYFNGLHGNTEASKVFNRWLKKQGIKKPDWFEYEEDNG